MNVPDDLRYSSDHEWVRVEDGRFRIGITDYAQDALGDVVFVELPEVGSTLAAAEEAGVVESVKAASDTYAPISGEIIEVNEDLEDAPERINVDPYGDGWMYKMSIEDAEELENLLDAEAYTDSIADDE